MNEEKSKKTIINAWAVLVVVGIVLFIVGMSLKLPSKKLDYYSYSDNTYEVEEYVGGDAYNYIIAASQWAGEYSARSTEKTLYICFGVALTAFGGIMHEIQRRKDTQETVQDEEK